MNSKLTEAITDLKQFDKYIEKGLGGSAVYFSIHTGTHSYLCRINRRSELFPYLTLTRTQEFALRSVVETSARFPPLFDLIPRMHRMKLEWSAISPPDLVVRKGRTKLFSFDDEIVYTISDRRIREEVRNRRLVPKEVHVPSILEFDEEYPYMAEELVRGRHPKRSLEDWDLFERVFKELYPLYDNFSGEQLDVDEFLTQCEDHHLMNRTLEAIEDYGVPEYLPVTRVHGDLAHKNIIISDGAPYILDWERSRKEILVSDFFHLLVDICRGHDSTKIIADMIMQRGEACEILQYYIEITSPLLKSYEPGVPFLYLLYQISLVEQKQEAKEYIFLEKLLNQLGY